jgi:hypothetical protein
MKTLNASPPYSTIGFAAHFGHVACLSAERRPDAPSVAALVGRASQRVLDSDCNPRIVHRRHDAVGKFEAGGTGTLTRETIESRSRQNIKERKTLKKKKTNKQTNKKKQIEPHQDKKISSFIRCNSKEETSRLRTCDRTRAFSACTR